MDEPKLRILLLEDFPDDAELVTRELLQDGLRFDWRRVEDETGFLRELAEFSPDLILADYTMPNFDAMKALRILQEAGREIPFILVTGSQSEETAAAVMREGADDHILKSSLVRLPLSVRHTLERWRTKRALRESEERWQFALEGAGDGVWDWNPQTGVVYFSPQWKAMLGYGEEEIEPDGGEWEQLVHPDDRQETLARLEAYLQGLAPAYRSEYRLLCKDGNYKWTLSRGKMIRRDAGGKPLRVIGTQSDITERKRAEEALQESEERFRAIAEQTSDVVFITDTRGVITYLSPVATKVFGVPMDEMLDIHFIDLLPPESVDAAVAAFTDTIERGTSHRNLELKMKRKDGSEFYGELSGSLFKVGGFTGAAGTIRDITERKRAEEALRREQTMLARTEGIAQIGSWAWDIATDTVTWSDELFRIFQRDPKEGAPSFAEHPAFYHPDDMARLQQAVEVAVTLGTPYELELRAIRKDGETRVCMARGVAEMAPGGRAVHLFGSLQDIMERKQLEGEAEQARTDFLYAVSHELKTPSS